jgi:ABC-2 type transport system permease protein
MSADAVALDLQVVPRESAARPSLARLTKVELRKMVDTRAGFWLQLAVVALTVIAVVILIAFGHAEDQRFRGFLSVAIAPASVLLPVMGILLVTSEFSQRTAVLTFGLVPQRSRVIAAKLLACVVLSMIALVVCLPIAAIGTAIAAPDVADVWALPVGLLGQTALSLVTGMITGAAFGAALLSSAPAIVLSFVLPLGWAAVGSIPALEGAARWLDGTRSLAPMTEHLMDGTEWARAGTTLAVWMVLPLLIGLWRIARREIS